MAGPLEGIVMVDMARMGPGPFCATILGDMGADIIRIDQPGRGDLIPQEVQTRDATASSMGRNARSIGLNLKDEKARDIFYTLIEKADIFQEGFRPGVVKRLGLDYETVKEINPRLVYASISGFGQDGPYKSWAGHDINYVSTAGLLGMTGEKGGVPVYLGTVIADFAGGGMHTAIGILLALFHRERSGKGQYVDVSMTDGVMALTANVIEQYLQTGVAPRRGETMLGGLFPFYHLYECKEGKWISIGNIEPWLWANFCRAIGREEFIEAQFEMGPKREEITKELQKIFKTKTMQEWVDILGPANVCVGPVNDIEDVVTNPQINARHMIIEVDHPEKGKIKQVGHFIKLSDTPASVRCVTPTQGQHTKEILTELGYSDDEIAEMRQNGAVSS